MKTPGRPLARWIRPIPRAVTRPLSILLVLAWLAQMAVLVERSYGDGTANLATDLARYGSDAQWRGVYYRGEKIGFTVTQVVPLEDSDPDPDHPDTEEAGFELHEDGELQMSLLGAITAARLRTTARVDRNFQLQSFDFSLDPGTGPTQVHGEVIAVPGGQAVEAGVSNGRVATLALSITTAGGTRTEERPLDELPALSLNLARRLASAGLVQGTTYRWTIFDPATLRSAPALLRVGRRELVRGANGALPAFRVETEFVGLRTTSWVTDTGEIVREESPLGLMSVREPRDRAIAMAVPAQVRSDMLEAAAVVPVMDGGIAGRVGRLEEPRDVRRLRLRLHGVDLSGLGLDLGGVGQTVVEGAGDADGQIVETRDLQQERLDQPDAGAAAYLVPEPFIESDDPDIATEAQVAAAGAVGARAQAELLTRHVNALLEKKPTVSLPSAREVLRTKIGDCNEHTVLYVAMARALGIPARIAVGLTLVRGAFYYHAWPEVYLDGDGGAGWLPVDPTLNQFPADATHLRLARGGLDQQAVILPLIGQLQITVLDAEMAPESLVAVLDGGLVPPPAAALRADGSRVPAEAGAAADVESCWCWWRR